MSRRLVISAWAPGNAQTSKLPPCHCLFVFNVQLDDAGKPWLNLHLTQRSCDVALGVPYNLAGYALLLELFARFSGIPAARFAHTLIDAHVYTAKPDGSMAEYDHVPGLKERSNARHARSRVSRSRSRFARSTTSVRCSTRAPRRCSTRSSSLATTRTRPFRSRSRYDGREHRGGLARVGHRPPQRRAVAAPG